ncbi:MAG: hypothetical protein QM523_02425 [Candidatus Pacebacteria bacterium]|nr:hypothetical protein [Candidatus Paceibacterota bacterium]
MPTKYYHYTTIENAQRIASERKFRLKNINHTNDHSEGYQVRIEDLYNHLEPIFGQHYTKFQKYRIQQPKSIFFGSLTIEHSPDKLNNPLWRKYGISSNPNERVKFGKGACVELEFKSIPELNHFYPVLEGDSILSLHTIRYMPYAPKDLDFTQNFQQEFFDNFKNKHFKDEKELELNLKFLAWGLDYLFKSLIHKCESEIRLLNIHENYYGRLDDDLNYIELDLEFCRVHTHPLYAHGNRSDYLLNTSLNS